MTKRDTQPRDADDDSRPREINMTDLGWDENGELREEAEIEDIHAAGTPGGGTAVGGLAGTNIDDGSPNNADLEDALGSGLRDSAGEDEEGNAYGGSSGGAVGGTPAQKRVRGGDDPDGIVPSGRMRP